MARNSKESATYVRLPTIEGGWEFRRVDGDRWQLLSPQARAQLHESRTGKQKGGGQGFIPINTGRENEYEMEKLTKEQFLQRVLELRDQWQNALAQYGEAGKEVAKQLIQNIDFDSLACGISGGNPEECTEAFSNVIYTLMSGSCTIAEALGRMTTYADSMEGAVQALGEGSDDAKRELFFHWSLAATNVVAAVKDFEKIEADVRHKRSLVSGTIQRTEQMIGVQNPVIKEALDFLDGENFSFVFSAFRFLRNGTGTELEIRKSIETAVCHINACAGERSRAFGEWEKLGRIREDLQSISVTLGASIAEYARESTRLAEFEQRFGKTIPEPYSVPEEFKFTDEETYRRALAFLMDRNWGPQTVERRIRTLIDGTLALLSTRLNFSHELLSTLEKANQYIDELGGRKGEFPSPIKQTSSESDLAVAAENQQESISEARLKELVELAQCVALEVTCKWRYLSVTTFRSIFEILELLGKTTREEWRPNRERIREFIENPRHCEIFERNAKNITDRWRKSNRTWLAYYPSKKKRERYLKLALHAENSTNLLLTKYGLTRTQIREAYTKRRTQQNELHRTRVSNRQTEN